MNKFSLVGVNGNAFNVLAYTANAMKKAGFQPAEIREYERLATSGNYNTLLCLSVDKINECNERLGLTDEDEDDE